jgi:hypothetical protein
MGNVRASLVSAFREVVPLTPSESELNPASIFAQYTVAIDALKAGVPGNDDKTLLSSSERLYDGEVARHSSIDGRASGLMSAIGIAATLVTGLGLTTLSDVANLSPPGYVVVLVVYIAVLVYLAATAVIAFRVQGYMPRSMPDPTDLTPDAGINQTRSIACRLMDYTVRNYRENNRAAYLLYSGQKCFRNAVLVLVLGGLLSALITVTQSGLGSDASKLAEALALSAGCSDIQPLKVDAKGSWRGTCVVNHRLVSVTVTANGAASTKP